MGKGREEKGWGKGKERERGEEGERLCSSKNSLKYAMI